MFSYFKSHTAVMSVIIVAVIVIAAGVARSFRKPADDQTSTLKTVTLVNSSSFRKGGGDILTQGTVESEAEVDLKSQISAPVVAVNVSLGQWVSAGETLVNLQSSDIAAQLDQAKASLSLAEAQYANAGVSLESARQSAQDKIRDAYRKVDDAVHTEADQMFSNPTSSFPKLSFPISDQQLSNSIQFERQLLEADLNTWKTSVDTLTSSVSDSDLEAQISLSQKNLSDAAKFLDDLSSALNNAAVSGSLSATIASWKITVTTARASISGIISGLTAADQAIAAAKAVVKNPDSSASPSTGEAQVEAAKATVAGLESQLAKTNIKTPVSGRVSSLDVKLGDLVSPGASIASVTNEYALRVKAYVSDSDYAKIWVGLPVVINGRVSGEVENISPSIDQSSKKVEIKIAVYDSGNSGLVVGQNVPVTIKSGSDNTNSSAAYVVPIQDVKIVQGGAYVYTVDADSKIQRHDIKLGAVTGDFVEVTEGLSDDMSIASPVYELEVGQKVNTASSTTL